MVPRCRTCAESMGLVQRSSISGDLIIRKRVDKNSRPDEQKDFMSSWNGSNLWEVEDDNYRPLSNLAQCMCEKDGSESVS